MNTQNFSIEDVKRMDLVEYLEKLGYKPDKIRNNDYWYLSPLREEKTASFKVNRRINRWFDFGIGEGGSVVDFGIKYFNLTVGQFLNTFKNDNFQHLQPASSLYRGDLTSSTKEDEKSKIKIVDARSINSPILSLYLKRRGIDLEVARKFCSEVDFQLYNKQHTAIGFKNDTGGYELRNAYFKGSSSPKFTTLIVHNKDYNNLSVFEGFFNFLSHQTLNQQQNISEKLPQSQMDFLVLNSLSFFEMSRSLMERHNSVNLYLDRDKAGLSQTQQALKLSKKYQDCSEVYKGFKDYNDLLMNKPIKQQQEKRLGKRL